MASSARLLVRNIVQKRYYVIFPDGNSIDVWADYAQDNGIKVEFCNSVIDDGPDRVVATYYHKDIRSWSKYA